MTSDNRFHRLRTSVIALLVAVGLSVAGTALAGHTTHTHNDQYHWHTDHYDYWEWDSHYTGPCGPSNHRNTFEDHTHWPPLVRHWYYTVTPC